MVQPELPADAVRCEEPLGPTPPRSGQTKRHVHEQALLDEITRQVRQTSHLGPHNHLFACLEVLLRYQVMEIPKSIPAFDVEAKSMEDILYLEFSEPDDPSPGRSPYEYWNELQSEIQQKQETLLALPGFIRQALDTEQPELMAAINDITDQYSRHVQWLELICARLKNTMDLASSMKSTEMAKITIAETKRMMSCMCPPKKIVFVVLSFDHVLIY